MLKIIAWILFIYLIFRLAGYIFAPSRQNPESRRKGPTVLHRDKQGNKVTTRDEDDGEYIDYKEIK
jgi:hypothetical protein